MKTTFALFLIAAILLCYFGYESRQGQLAENAALDEACSAESTQLPADAAPKTRILACISWKPRHTPDINTPRG